MFFNVNSAASGPLTSKHADRARGPAEPTSTLGASGDTYSTSENTSSLFAVSSRSSFLHNGGPFLHVVKKGEWLLNIASRYGLTESDLRQANPALGDGLRPGQEIRIPGRWHRVQTGDTLYSLARASHLTTAQLGDMNDLQGALIRIGQLLFIPGSDSTTPSTGAGFTKWPSKKEPSRAGDPPSANASAKLENGTLIHSNVTQNVIQKIEHGNLPMDVHAIVLHQTATDNDATTLNGFKTSKRETGAHFLIGTNGTIYQTARLDKKVWHVGKIRSRCLENKTCGETSKEHKILHGDGSFKSRVHDLSDHEIDKSYPDRYPINSDALGIEIVGEWNASTETWDAVSAKQNEALQWLIPELQEHFDLGNEDVYYHNQISRKKEGEAESADWQH